MMRVSAVMPIKLKNERCPGKNTRLLGGKPLMQHELDNLKATGLCDSIEVFCSSEDVVPFIPDGVGFLKRPASLDLPTSNFSQIFSAFMEQRPSDIYVYAHATAPFITIETMRQCIEAVKSGIYDSAFCATLLQDFLWKNGVPLNFDATNLPRTQDLDPIYKETSGVYVFTREVFEKYHRRIGLNPFIKEVTFKEAIDIDEPEDFELAETFAGLGSDPGSTSRLCGRNDIAAEGKSQPAVQLVRRTASSNQRDGITWLVMDVDGTLTDGKVYIGSSGEAFKAFDIKDGLGIHEILPRLGITPVIITGRESEALARRCDELGIRELHQGVSDKLGELSTLLGREGGALAQVAYIGDDVNDIPCMQAVRNAGGVTGCPADADEAVKQICDFISPKPGGAGAVRSFIAWLADGKETSRMNVLTQ